MPKRGRPFGPGNKFGQGRPAGSPNKKTLVMQELEEHGPALLDKAMAKALDGDPQMLRTLLPYILPRPKDPPVKTGPLRMDTTEDLLQTLKGLARKVESGQLTPRTALEIDALLESRCRLLETQELEKRVRALELLLVKEGDKAA